jgi:hypothetical protein
MDFSEAYIGADWQPRTDTVHAPALQPLFDTLPDDQDGRKPRAKFKIRNLEGPGYYGALHAENRAKIESQMATALTGKVDSGGMGEMLSKLVEQIDITSPRIAVDIEILMAGCMEPKIDKHLALLIAKNHPSILRDLAVRIEILTDGGPVLSGKSPSS